MQQWLFVDADDTLWENNIYFEEAIHRFIEFLAHSSMQVHEVRAVLNEVEHTAGYGSKNFARSLVETYHRLVEREVRGEDLDYVKRLGEEIAHHPLQILEGVEETLKELAQKHHLVLLTKGEREEQQLKVERSGLESYFQRIVVVEEKNTRTYELLTQEFQCPLADTWMIGNSPKSDINPALEAGLNAVFIPHEHTWVLEHQELREPGPGRLLILDTFADLRALF
ncbi:haloacid dehalogenase [Ktedonobacter sp. SOSP1-85]|uniref:HAD family hydrolase n=1 Tax=Ktedonobacter sp. SOSP1-85 TaxID=2778367 RepID=UPI0019151145|nr:HAD family hydrolase [Ktedonobacter sp. SOSP1-85]GHO72789.1 haloacid dehalogenase [Ktedonobacter sp. SOSP1-85]